MSADDPAPISPDLRDVLDDEREPPGIPTTIRDRMRGRLDAILDAPLPDPGGGNRAVSAAKHAGRESFVRALGAHPFRLAAATFIVGGGVGAGVHATLRAAPPPRVITVVEPAHHESTVLPTVAMLPDATVLITQPSVPVAADVATPSTANATSLNTHRIIPTAHSETPSTEPSADPDLAAERAAIEIARTAISRGQGALAISALERHARQFPNGRLTEHREALWIQALVTVGRGDEARSRADRFRTRFPQSIFIPVVEASLRSLEQP